MAKATVTKERKEQLINEMCAYFKEHKITHAPEGVRAMVNTWARQKINLIRMLRKHPDWDEQRLVIPTKTVLRGSSGSEEVKQAATLLIDLVTEYIRRRSGCSSYRYVTHRTLNHNKDELRHYFIPDETAESCLTAIAALLIVKSWNTVKVVDIEVATAASEIGLDFKIGQKMSRAINKTMSDFFLKHLDPVNDGRYISSYNARYAVLSDALATKEISTKAFLSLHPMDYINMANGNSWDSCQIVGEKDCGGSYRAGTLSYMGDKVSAVFYTISPKSDSDTPLYNLKKVSRMMVHYTGGVMVQGRLYPQGDSKMVSLVNTYRDCVKHMIARCEGVSDNAWTTEVKVTDYYSKIKVRTASGSKHYPDYQYSSYNCHHTSIIGLQEESGIDTVSIGSRGKCLRCGSPLTERGELICSCCLNQRRRCGGCGTPIMGDAVYTVPDKYGYSRYACKDCHDRLYHNNAASEGDINCPF